MQDTGIIWRIILLENKRPRKKYNEKMAEVANLRGYFLWGDYVTENG